MLGHKLWRVFRDRFETWTTVRCGPAAAEHCLDPGRTLISVDVVNFDSVIGAFARCRPDVVVNCVGVIKQLPEAKDPLISLTVNSVFPHRLAGLCGSGGARLIHISTDCVFSGLKGMYTEDDKPDPDDLYGRTKLLGEVSGPNCLTLRTSMIGPELGSSNGLLEWLLHCNERKVNGYTRAMFSGLTTGCLAGVVADLIDRHAGLSGIYHVSSAPISKFDLLTLIRDAYKLDVDIEPFEDVRIDRSLNSIRFREATGFVPQDWPAMVREMARDRSGADHVEAFQHVP
jgi:dTDP-4-dehydrorhamnose reductase